MSRIQLTQTECAGSEPIHSTPVQPNSPVRQGQDICNTNAVPTGKEGLLSNQTYRQPINVSGIEQDAQNARMCPRHKKDDQVELTSIVQQKEEIRTPQDINDDDWSEKRTGKTKTIQQSKTQPEWTIPKVEPPSDGDDSGRAMDNADVSGPFHQAAQLGRDAMGRIILTDGVHRMMPRIQQTQMECTVPEPTRLTPGKYNQVQLNSPMQQGKEIRASQETIDDGCKELTPESKDTYGGTEGSPSASVTEEVLDKIQNIADTVSNNVWLTMTLVILTTIRRAGQNRPFRRNSFGRR